MVEHSVPVKEAHSQTVAGTEAHGGGHAPEPTVMGLGGAWFVSAAMLAVILIIFLMKVPSMISTALDRQIGAIRAKLKEAEQLRAEAEALRNEYQAKADAADAERETMLDRAKQEAKAIVKQAKADTAALIERRSRMAEDKIAAAERQAIEDVRALAASSAAAAAAQLIAEELGPEGDKPMVDRAIKELGRA